MANYEGKLSGITGRFAIVAARFNQVIVDRLVEGARDGLKRHGLSDDAIDLAWVPGSMEIPLIARKLADTKKYAAIICLGCVIQGETDHYDYVCSQVVQGTSQVALTTGLPVIFGVLTCQTLEQALNRAGGKSGNKGFDAALAALEMVSLTQSILP